MCGINRSDNNTIVQRFLRRGGLLLTINASCVLGAEIYWDKGPHRALNSEIVFD